MKWNIRTRIALSAGGCLLIAALLLVTYGLFSANATQSIVSQRMSTVVERNVIRNLKDLATARAGTVRSTFQVGLDAAEVLAKERERNNFPKCLFIILRRQDVIPFWQDGIFDNSQC